MLCIFSCNFSINLKLLPNTKSPNNLLVRFLSFQAKEKVVRFPKCCCSCPRGLALSMHRTAGESRTASPQPAMAPVPPELCGCSVYEGAFQTDLFPLFRD